MAKRNMKDAHGEVLCEIASTSAHHVKGDALVKNEAKLVTVLQPEKEGV